jgi:hypothetical protein
MVDVGRMNVGNFCRKTCVGEIFTDVKVVRLEKR